MGNTEVCGRGYDKVAGFGGIYLNADKPSYKPGEQFTGTIYLNLLSQYPGDKLYIQLKGNEHYQNLIGSNELILKEVKNVILDLKIPVHTENGGFNAGQYAFPVSFLIPSGIPGSYYQEELYCVAEVEYILQVVLDTFDAAAPKLKYRQRLIINEGIKYAKGSTQLEKSFETSTCLCCGQGSTSLSIHFENNGMVPGETNKMFFSVNNADCKLNCPSVVCTLKETLTLDNTYTFSNDIKTFTISGFNAAEVLKDKFIEFKLPEHKPNHFRSKNLDSSNKIAELKKKTRNAQNLASTTTSKIVKTQFKMFFTFQFSGCLCAEPPSVDIPVQVFCPPLKNAYSPQIPAGWAPQIMGTTNIALSADHARKGNAGNFQEYSKGKQNQTPLQANTNSNLIQTIQPNGQTQQQIQKPVVQHEQAKPMNIALENQGIPVNQIQPQQITILTSQMTQQQTQIQPQQQDPHMNAGMNVQIQQPQTDLSQHQALQMNLNAEIQGMPQQQLQPQMGMTQQQQHLQPQMGMLQQQQLQSHVDMNVQLQQSQMGLPQQQQLQPQIGMPQQQQPQMGMPQQQQHQQLQMDLNAHMQQSQMGLPQQHQSQMGMNVQVQQQQPQIGMPQHQQPHMGTNAQVQQQPHMGLPQQQPHHQPQMDLNVHVQHSQMGLPQQHQPQMGMNPQVQQQPQMNMGMPIEHPHMGMQQPQHQQMPHGQPQTGMQHPQMQLGGQMQMQPNPQTQGHVGFQQNPIQPQFQTNGAPIQHNQIMSGYPTQQPTHMMMNTGGIGGTMSYGEEHHKKGKHKDKKHKNKHNDSDSDSDSDKGKKMMKDVSHFGKNLGKDIQKGIGKFEVKFGF